MKIEGQATINALPEKVWNALLDPRVISRCIPGCHKLREMSVDKYSATLEIGIGAISGTYQGTLQVKEKIPPSRYSMAFEGHGAQGFVRGFGEAQLQGKNGVTVVSYECNVEVGGLIASVGQRMLEGLSKFLLNQMFTKLQAYVGEEERE